MPDAPYNPHAPEMTEQEADDVVDAFLHILVESCDEHFGVKATLAGQLSGRSKFVQRLVMKRLQKRLDHFRRKAHTIDL